MSKKMRGTSVFMLMLMLMVCSMCISAFASSTTQDGLEVTFTTDKESYEQDDKVTATLTVTNTNKDAVTNISMEGMIPEGYKLTDSTESVKKIESLDAGETVSMNVVYVKDKIDHKNNDDNKDNKNNNDINKNTKETVDQTAKGNTTKDKIQDSSKKTPKTGDDQGVFLWIGLSVLAAGGVIVLIIKKKKLGKTVLSVILCIVITGNLIDYTNYKVSADDSKNSIVISEKIHIGKDEVELKASVGYDDIVKSDNDDDGVPDIIEDLIGSDPNNKDTDEDGLTDGEEYNIVGTDPVEKDTDGDGINDNLDDEDEDEINNAEEVKIGTNPLKTDTDEDGLNDKEEIDQYHTNPTVVDTDGDTLSDGDEVKLGLDPLSPSTDGVTPDAERKIQQTLDDDCVDDELKQDNLVVPSVSGDVQGNIDSHVYLEEADLYAANDNRAVIGKQVEVHTDYDSDVNLKLNFTLDESDVRAPFYMICQYVDGEFVPCETNRDGNSIWTTVNAGTYFVVDAELLLIDLNIPINKYKNMASKSELDSKSEKYDACKNVDAPENADLTTDEITNNTTKYKSADKEYGRIAGQADIVFVIDTTGSMGSSIKNVVKNINGFVDRLETEYTVNANFALVDYRDITCGEATSIVKNGTSAWFSNVEDFKAKIDALTVDGGGDTPETAIDGLGMAEQLDFRQNANKFVILVTDADFKVNNNYGMDSMNMMTKKLGDSGIVTSVISANKYESDYHNLYTDTNGVFGDIYGNFADVLLQLADKIGEVVNDGSWVILSDYQFIKLGQPLDDSGFSSDEDSLSDKAELGDSIDVNLKPYISWVMKNYDVPEGMFDDISTLKVYKYKTNPILPDTDFDGINDDKDPKPFNGNTFEGKMKGYYDVNDAEYKFDYRNFFGSEYSYNKDLSNMSLIFANTIYDKCGFSYNEDREYTDIKQLMEYHGFTDVVDYKLAEGYNNNGIKVDEFSDDDISEIAIGYHKVKYNGLEKTIVGVIIRGTNGTIQEWSSNFDMGDPDEWNSEYHKGFYITEERIKDFVGKYVNQYLGDAEHLTYWVTGHSRGAALANILAARLLEEGNTVYAYTFATPATTISDAKDNSLYKSIFNYTNNSDFVTYVPLKQWDFGRFGNTMEFDISSSGEKTEWSNSTGQKKYNALKESVIKLATGRIAKSCSSDWESVYDYAGDQNISDSQYKCISERAKKYCKLKERTSIFGNHNGYKLYPSTAFLFQLGAEEIAGSDKEKDNVVEILKELWNSKYSGVILLFLGDAAWNWKSFKDMKFDQSLIGDGHAPATYYVGINYRSHGGGGRKF